MSDSGGSLVPGSEARYTPFGDWRTEPTAGLTDRGYTGHKSNNLGGGADDLGLIYMNARYYGRYLNRFISADTIVPDPADPQQFNRYTHSLNNPVNFTDPTGHCAEGQWGDDYEDASCLEIAQYVAHKYGYDFNKLTKYDWSLASTGMYSPRDDGFIEHGGRGSCTLTLRINQKSQNGHNEGGLTLIWPGKPPEKRGCPAKKKGVAPVACTPGNR